MALSLATLHFSPLLPLWLLAALALILAAALAPALWRRARGAGWRLMAAGALLLWLAGPLLQRESRLPLPAIALLAVDHGAAMRAAGRIGAADRAATALTAEAAALPGLVLRRITVDDRARFFPDIARALAVIPPAQRAGIIALTDGQSGPPPADPPGAPLHVLAPGHPGETDRRLQILAAPAFALVGQNASVVLRVDDLGVTHPAAQVALDIRQSGAKVRRMIIPTGQAVTLHLPITQAGPALVGLQTAPLGGAISAANSRAALTINGVRDRLHVLLVSGEPNPGERAWRRLLKSDPSVELVHFTILRPPDKEDSTPVNELALIPFPERQLFIDKIRDFDLVILDRFADHGLLPFIYLDSLARYVRAGGALLVVAGPEFAGPGSLAQTPLASVLPALPARTDPVLVGRFRPRLSAIGARHPVTTDLPGANHPGSAAPPRWGPWFRAIAVQVEKGETLMQGPRGTPLLVLAHRGAGRVALLASDQSWLWSRGFQGGGPQAELLRRVAHWLMREPQLAGHALRAHAEHGQLVIDWRSTATGPPPPLTLTDPAGHQTHPVLRATGPGRAQASLPASLPGIWRVRDGQRSAEVAVGLDKGAGIADLRARPRKLAGWAAESGGSAGYLPASGVPALRFVAADGKGSGAKASGDGWIGLRRSRASLVSGITDQPALPDWLALPLILALLLAGWRREGR